MTLTFYTEFKKTGSDMHVESLCGGDRQIQVGTQSAMHIRVPEILSCSFNNACACGGAFNMP